MMSVTDKSGNREKHLEKNSSDAEQNCQTEEEISDDSFSDSITKLKNISIENDFKNLNAKKRVTKNQLGRLTVSLRYGKSYRHCRAIKQSRKVKKRKKFVEKSKNCLEKPIETPKKGKRCRLGGKAKGKPPEEESSEKRESDDESDNSYFGRVSLGYFQKFVDKSGASTSYQLEEDCKDSFSLYFCQRMQGETSEETELLELQKWGMTGLVSSYNTKSQRLGSTEDIQPDI